MLHHHPRNSRGLRAMQKQPSWAALAVIHASSYDQVNVLVAQVEEFNHLLHQHGYPVKDMILGVAFVEKAENGELLRRLQVLAKANAIPIRLTVVPIRQCFDEFGFASNALALEAAHKGCDTYLFWAPSTIDYFNQNLLRVIGEGFERGLSAMGGITSRDVSLLGTGHIVRNISVYDANLFHMFGGFSVRTDSVFGGFGNLIKPEEGETSRLVMAFASHSLSSGHAAVFSQIDLSSASLLHRPYGRGINQIIEQRADTRLRRYNGPLPSHALPVIQDLAGEPLRF